VETTSREAREDKLSWLQRPFDWALRVCAINLGIDLLLWQNGAGAYDIALAAVSSLVIATGLLIWGIVRMQNAARRRVARQGSV
jgi:hypothetical protein